MKLLLTTLNSKFTHSSLALRYIKRYLKTEKTDVTLSEYTINHQLDYIVREIFLGQYDVVAFSVYIWNIEQTLLIARNLKKVQPEVTIIFGGPEVTYDSDAILRKNPCIDYIVRGEGEVSFSNLINRLEKNDAKIPDQSLKLTGETEIKGVTYRAGDSVVIAPDQPLINNLDSIPFPYDTFDGLDHRILYYESSRGCPFNCQYCLSSTIKGVRFFSLERVKSDLKQFVELNVKQVKFIDRTFNADPKRTMEIFEYLCAIDNGYTNFHFEITADRLTEDVLVFLKSVRPGLFQFEIGVQSTHEPTLEEIKRYVSFEKLKSVCTRIKSYQNIHLHLDLIAGLPYENYERFMESFDDVYSMRPEMVQLGFLKLLKGSGLRIRKDQYGYIYNEAPPYEVMASSWIDFKDQIRLKGIEDMVEHFYNNLKFTYSLEFIIKANDLRPSELYEALSEFWHTEGWHHKAHTQDTLYTVLESFYKHQKYAYSNVFKNILKFDYVRQSTRRKLYMEKETPETRQAIHAFLQAKENLETYLPEYKDQPAKQIVKKVRFESFEFDVLKFIQTGFNLEMMRNHTVYEPVTILFDYNVKSKIFETCTCHVINAR